MTFGEIITQARGRSRLTQKHVAGTTLKENGIPISASYLNNIEHDRRNPPREYIMRQLANTLGLEIEYLCFLAGRIPTDIVKMQPNPETVQRAMANLRRNIQSGLEIQTIDS